MNTPSHQSEIRGNRSMPPGTIIPKLVYPDLAAAVAWLCTTFGFRERLRIGNHRSQLVFGSAAMIAVAQPAGYTFNTLDPLHSQLTHALMVRVEDVDRHYAQVKQCGAQIIAPPTDFPYGERQYTVEDLAGHRWTFSQSIADVDPQEWGGVLTESADDTA
jgi:uncharacterized glyoxalase superfamily protein PhnB